MSTLIITTNEVFKVLTSAIKWGKDKETDWKERGKVLFICKQNGGVCRKPMGQKVVRTNKSVWQGHGK